MDTARTLSPNKAKSRISHAITKKRPVFIWGPPGIGKSDIVHQIGDALDAHVIDVRLSLWEPTDIKGIPYYSAEDNEIWEGVPGKQRSITLSAIPTASKICAPW